MKFFHIVLYNNGLFILIFIYSFLLSSFYEYIKMYPFYHCQTSRLLLVLHQYDNIYFFQWTCICISDKHKPRSYYLQL